MRRKEIVSLIILCLVIGYGAWRYITRSFSAERINTNLLDTKVTIIGESKSKNVGAKIDSVFAYIKGFEAKFNDYDPGSWVSKLNSSGGKPFPMDPDAYELLCLADSLYRLTDGKFDITIKPLYDLWGFSSLADTDSLYAQRVPPDSLEIQKTLALIGFDRVRFNRERVILPAGMELSFGALAKGYALERAKEYMQRHGFISGILDCTSSMSFFGHKIARVVGIQHPRPTETQATIGSFKLRNGAISTSGDYQLGFDYANRRYHHIIDPQTGYPVENVFSVTVIHPNAAWADGLSTALFLLQPNRAIEVLDKYPGSNAVIYYQDNSGIVELMSKGMKDLDWHAE